MSPTGPASDAARTRLTACSCSTSSPTWVDFGWVDVEEVVEVLRDRPGSQHVVVAGRDAPPELVAVADLVSDVAKVKHPNDEGIRAQKGTEW